jgi:hypothetical protein
MDLRYVGSGLWAKEAWVSLEILVMTLGKCDDSLDSVFLGVRLRKMENLELWSPFVVFLVKLLDSAGPGSSESWSTDFDLWVLNKKFSYSSFREGRGLWLRTSLDSWSSSIEELIDLEISGRKVVRWLGLFVFLNIARDSFILFLRN